MCSSMNAPSRTCNSLVFSVNSKFTWVSYLPVKFGMRAPLKGIDVTLESSACPAVQSIRATLSTPLKRDPAWRGGRDYIQPPPCYSLSCVCYFQVFPAPLFGKNGETKSPRPALQYSHPACILRHNSCPHQ